MTLQLDAHQVHYPDSDGKPMADNTRQFRYIVLIEGGLESLFRSDPLVFVAGDLLWYPVEGDNRTRQAPDALVAFGRPKGDRGSYKQWEEGGIAPQVVFEVLSPGNTRREMAGKRRWYAQYGVEEYYEYDPDRGQLRGWLREGEDLREIGEMAGWISPRLGVRFDLEGLDLVLVGPDGRRFDSYVEQARQRAAAEARADQEQKQKELAERRAEQERMRAVEVADQLQHERARAAQAEERSRRLAERLRELGLADE